MLPGDSVDEAAGGRCALRLGPRFWVFRFWVLQFWRFRRSALQLSAVGLGRFGFRWLGWRSAFRSWRVCFCRIGLGSVGFGSVGLRRGGLPGVVAGGSAASKVCELFTANINPIAPASNRERSFGISEDDLPSVVLGGTPVFGSVFGVSVFGAAVFGGAGGTTGGAALSVVFGDSADFDFSGGVLAGSVACGVSAFGVSLFGVCGVAAGLATISCGSDMVTEFVSSLSPNSFANSCLTCVV